jgi:acetoacetate decarboxylase
MPASSPMFAPPPFKYVGNRQVNVLFRTKPETIHRLVPAPLQPNPDNIVALYFSALTMVEPFKLPYEEVGIFVPVVHAGIPGIYFDCMYLDTDNVAGIACGREIWGFPKKEASIHIEENGGKLTATVSRMGSNIISASFERQKKLDPIPPSPYQAFYNLKVIPSVNDPETPDVMQLTSTAMIGKSAEVFEGSASLTLSNSVFDPLGEIPILAIVNAQLDVYDMTLAGGKVAFDYLKQK